MKAGWQIKTLGEVCDFQRGLTYSKSDEVEFSENIVIRATNINLSTNLLDFTELKYINNNVVVQENKKLKKDCIIICTASGSKSHLGKVAYIDDDYDYAFGGFMGMLAPKSMLVPKYLFHLMTSVNYKDFIANLSDGANINNLKFDDLKRFSIHLASVFEQQRIVAILDEAFEQIAIARANTEKNLQNARALFESHLQNVFTQRGEGFEAKTFDEVLVIKNGKDQKPVEKVGGKYPIYGSAGNVMGWTDSYICDEQTTIIGRKGTINRPIFIETKFWNVDTAFGLAAKPNLNAKFLYFFCLSYDFSLHNRGTTIPSLVKTDLLNIKISVPSLTVQEQLVEKFSALHKETQHLESIYQRKLTALDDLKKSLLHKAFAGEL